MRGPGNPPAATPASAGHVFHEMLVKQADDLTPHMRRIRFGGSGITHLASEHPAAWIKLFMDDDGRPSRIGRAYTVRRLNRSAGEIDMDFVIHGEGPLSLWAQRARPGDRLHGVGPRGGHRPHQDAREYVLMGDPSAMPALFSILESLPAGMPARAFVEIADDGERQTVQSSADVTMHWLVSRPGQPLGTRLVEAAADLDPLSGSSVWAAAESGIVQTLRRHFFETLCLDRRRVSAAGYWKRGDLDYRDPDAEWR